jgi:cyanophycin synthetase
MEAQYNKTPDGRNINVFTYEYFRAAQELGLSAEFITPPQYRVQDILRVSNGKKTIVIIKSIVPINTFIGVKIALDKHLTIQMLKEAGVPTPLHELISSSNELTLNFPVVVKPTGSTKGKGISTNIRSNEELDSAIKYALAETEAEEGTINAIVEEQLKGFDHRVLVLEGKVIAATRKKPAEVTADGVSTIENLIKKENQTEKRITRKLSEIKIDDDMYRNLESQGLNMQTISEKGQTIQLHRISNLSKGGTTENVSDVIHPAIQDIAIKATKACNLTLAGVDIMCPDITKEPGENNPCRVIEVNGSPGSRLHLYPSEGEMVDTPKIILSHLFNLN